ncbi:pre-rRNA-processing protein TSR2 homolog [Leguminivora glycinivorella]|uniref:pre-rRNA-processing protein TSR2 homolog n=1 Tax=Leguminivora glycinivorella TaxID=1035111 RepID=UPI0020106CD1|nr:pre-rRNA-processing protein TSR2 homolog [Leguminivora glycinivorella]
MAMFYDDFKPLVDLVLNNWTALQLAIDHGMGSSGPKTGQLVSDYITRYCVENLGGDVDNLTEVLEDLMDEEFDTMCEDNSPKEVAIVLLQYFTLLREGKRDELQARIAAMPVCQKGLSQNVRQPMNPGEDSDSSSEDEGNDAPTNGTVPQLVDRQQQPEPEPMDEDVDPGWTVVRTRRKK